MNLQILFIMLLSIDEYLADPLVDLNDMDLIIAYYESFLSVRQDQETLLPHHITDNDAEIMESTESSS